MGVRGTDIGIAPSQFLVFEGSVEVASLGSEAAPPVILNAGEVITVGHGQSLVANAVEKKNPIEMKREFHSKFKEKLDYRGNLKDPVS